MTTGRTHQFCYIHPLNSSLIGERFNCEYLNYLEELELVDSKRSFINFKSKKSITDRDIVFVTATSDDHFNHVVRSLTNLRKFYSEQKVLIYGLDLSEELRQNVTNLKNVEFRQFNYSKYPKYVRNWCEYRFKPLILAEVLIEHDQVWWMDAHIVVKEKNMAENVLKELSGKNNSELKSSFVFFLVTSHTNFAVLNFGLLKFIPTHSISELTSPQVGMQLGANSFYVARTEFNVELIKWWVLCALEEKCMNPAGAKVKCEFGKNRIDIYAKCFRYDQSVINLLLMNQFEDHRKFYKNIGDLTSHY